MSWRRPIRGALIATIGLALFLPHDAEAVKKGAKAPSVELPLLDGKAIVRLADFAGKVVLVDFWASWCKPCKKELRALARLQARLAKRGLVILAISVDEDRSRARRFAKKVGQGALRWLWDRGGEKVASRYAPPKMPTSFLIGRGGVIRYIHRGFRPADLATIEAEVQRLLRR